MIFSTFGFLIFLLKKYLSDYLTQQVSRWHTGSSVLVVALKLSAQACKLLVVACRGSSSLAGQNPDPLHWECGVLASGPPGDSPTDDGFIRVFYDVPHHKTRKSMLFVCFCCQFVGSQFLDQGLNHCCSNESPNHWTGNSRG